MATTPQVTSSERLWSEEVGIARAGEPVPTKDTAYEWSNERKFVEGDGPYGNNNQQPGHGTDANP